MDNPRNWSKGRKWYYTFFSASLLFNVTLASSAPSATSTELIKHLHGSHEVTILVTSLFVAGFIVGPLLWAPLGEMYGRRPIFIYTMIIFCCWTLAAALAPNLASLIVFRFLAGTFAAAPITNSGGVCADLWSPVEIGTPMALFAIAPFLGPILGPIIGGFLGMINIDYSWRLIHWLLLLINIIFTVAVIFSLPETYGPILLARKAQKKREETKDERWWAKSDKQTGSGVFLVAITRPTRMLIKEPILALICVYLCFVYGLIYLLFIAYPIVFQGYYGMSPGVGSLPFLGVGLGAITGVLNTPYYNRIYARAFVENGNKPVPEKRLLGNMIGGLCLVVGLFMFAGTAHVHWILPTLAGVFLGYGILWCFISSLSYLTDCYRYLTASAFAASAVTRSICGAGAPLFAQQMFDALGTAGAASLLGGCATLLLPVPFLFYRYGPLIRKKSTYAFE
ncbi:MFS general substrate transporter [Atractiella rhizophila]|nr:MFS general substrate transporter [Atractiella rhizophila]